MEIINLIEHCILEFRYGYAKYHMSSLLASPFMRQVLMSDDVRGGDDVTVI